MAERALRECYKIGCYALTRDTYCDKHKMTKTKDTRQSQAEYDSRRGTAAQRGYDSKWTRARAAYLAAYPLCASCKDHGSIVPATVVDHIVPHRGDKKLFWRHDNWQPLCKTCHDLKTRRGA